VQSQYRRPELAVQPRWSNAGDPLPSGPDRQLSNADWWQSLGDPAINLLVQHAMADNPTLDEALARVDQARAQVATDRAGQSPRIDLTASATRSQIADTDTSGTGLSVRPIRQSGAAVGPSFSWEIDLWGRLRQRRAAAQGRLDARLADVDAARLSVAAQIADVVIVLRACRLSLEIRDGDIASRARELAISRQRLAFGSIAPADVAGAETNLANARTDRHAVQGSCLRSRDALVSLSGSDAAQVEAAIAVPRAETVTGSVRHADEEITQVRTADPSTSLPVPPNSTPALPASVLLHHPAVVAAERELAARWMEIGVAKAERLPRLDLAAVLTGQWLSALGSSSSFTTWSAGLDLSMPLLDGGAGKAKVRLTQARYRESLASLKGVMRDAARDVEDSLADQQSADARVISSGQAVSAARFTFQADQARWRAGAISAFDLEISRRALNTAQESATIASRDRARAWIALVRSTGTATEHQNGTGTPATIGHSCE
jgi:outer membrane protein TolC